MRFIIIKDPNKAPKYLNGFSSKGPRWVDNVEMAKTYNTKYEIDVVTFGLEMMFPNIDLLVKEKHLAYGKR